MVYQRGVSARVLSNLVLDYPVVKFGNPWREDERSNCWKREEDP
jgi:hypothetical protein